MNENPEGRSKGRREVRRQEMKEGSNE